MELFPVQPDLSLQISLPNTQSTSCNRRRRSREEDEEMKNVVGFWNNRASDLEQSTTTTKDTCTTFDLSLSNPNTNLISHQNHYFHEQQEKKKSVSEEVGFVRAIRGIPIYDQKASSSPTIFALHSQRSTRGFHPKRCMRAPRMRWTSTLHARFLHAVQLLGGHQSIIFFFSFILT